MRAHGARWPGGWPAGTPKSSGDERSKEQICIEANRLENAARAVRDMATEEELNPTRSLVDEMTLIGVRSSAASMKECEINHVREVLNV